MKNGGKNKCFAFIILFIVNIYIYIKKEVKSNDKSEDLG